MTTLQRFSHWLAGHRFAVDVASVVLLGPPLVLVSFELADPLSRWSAWWGVVVTLPLVARRRWPVLSAVAVYAISAVQVVLGPPLLIPVNLVVLVSLYSVTVHGPRWAGRAAMAGTVAGAVAFVVRIVVELDLGLVPQAATFGSVIVVSGLAAWALALLRRSRQDTLDALHDRAERLERERDQQERIAAASERARIAREMHDIVAHSLSVVIAQADGGRYAARQDPASAVPVLETIAATGRSALVDVRRILGVLRADDGDASGLAPQPTAGDVAELLDGVRAAGLAVSLVDVGTPTELPAGVELTVFRVLQEALTNVLKHAGPDPSVTVHRRWGVDHLGIDVVDDGRGAAAAGPGPGGGNGLVGMRERVALFEGTLVAGPHHGGGFEVRVELPLAAGAGDERTRGRGGE